MTAVTQVLRLTLPDDAAPEDAAAGVKRRIAAAAGAPDFAPARRAELAEARGAGAGDFRAPAAAG